MRNKIEVSTGMFSKYRCIFYVLVVIYNQMLAIISRNVCMQSVKYVYVYIWRTSGSFYCCCNTAGWIDSKTVEWVEGDCGMISVREKLEYLEQNMALCHFCSQLITHRMRWDRTPDLGHATADVLRCVTAHSCLSSQPICLLEIRSRIIDVNVVLRKHVTSTQFRALWWNSKNTAWKTIPFRMLTTYSAYLTTQPARYTK